MKHTKTKFVYSPTTVATFQEQEGQLQEKLLPEVYTLMFHKMMGYYLERTSTKYTLPEKLYGSINKKADKIIRAYQRRTKGTGALLTGKKGSGKSELIKVTANKMLELGYPVIVINEPYNGQDFMTYIASLGECVLVFDEFAKTYRKGATSDDVADPQENLLTLFDGLLSSKKLILISENNERQINEFMLNRPGRIFYHFKYDKIENDVITEYCEALNIRPTFIQELIDAKTVSYEFSFDILMALVEEHLSYPDESLDALAEDMNVDLAESIYRLSNVKVSNPLIDLGVLHPVEDSVIQDFDPLGYENQPIRLKLTDTYLDRFPEVGHFRRYVIDFLNRFKELIPDKEAAKFVETLKQLPIVKQPSDAVVSHYADIDIYLDTDTIVNQDGSTYVFHDKGTTIIGKLTKHKKSLHYYGVF